MAANVKIPDDAYSQRPLGTSIVCQPRFQDISCSAEKDGRQI